MLQWHQQAVEPAGDARSDLWFTYHLGRRIRAKLAASSRRGRPAGRWTSPGITRPSGPLDEPDADAVLAEINGWDADGKPLSAYTQLAGDGSTACGCWIYCGVARRRDQPDRPAQAGTGAELGRAGMGLGLAGQPAGALQPGLGRPGRQALERAQGAGLVGRGARRWAGHDVPDFIADRPPSYRPARGRHGRRRDLRHRPVHHAGRRQGLAVRARPGWSTAPCRRTTSRRNRRSRNLLYGQQHNPVRQIIRHKREPVPAQRRRARLGGVPLRDDHVPADRAPHRRRHVPVPALPGRAAARVLLRGLARARRRAAAWSTSAGPRSSPRAARSRPGCWSPSGCGRCGCRAGRCTRSGCPGTGAPNGLTTGDAANELAHLSLDPNVHIQEVKALACDIRPGAARAGRRCASWSGPTRHGPASPTRQGRRCEMSTTPADPSTAPAQPGLDPAAHAGYGDHPPRMGFFTDTSVCIGCKACEVACKTGTRCPRTASS